MKKPKPTKKTKPRWTGKPASVWAVKKSVKSPPEWMPSTVVLTLEGEPTGKLLEPCGWSVCKADGKQHRQVRDTWPRDRVEANLDRIMKSWEADNGAGWKLEIR